jgi:hypothetical protein
MIIDVEPKQLSNGDYVIRNPFDGTLIIVRSGQ